MPGGNYAQDPSASDDDEEQGFSQGFSQRQPSFTAKLSSSSDQCRRSSKNFSSGRVFSDRANSLVPPQRQQFQGQQFQDEMAATRSSSKSKGKKAASKAKSSAPSRTVTEADRALKLQESELKILELQKEIATLKENRGDDRKSSAEAQENEGAEDEDSGPPPLYPPAPVRMRKLKGASAYDIPLSSELEDHIIAIVKQKIWRTCKFISNTDQLDRVCEQIMEMSPELQKYANKALKKEVREGYRASLATNYGEKICGTINSTRTTVQSNIRKAYVERACSGRSMPTAKELLDIVRRKNLVMESDKPKVGQTEEEFRALERKVQRNMDWFLWYWDKLLVAETGKENWCGSIRHYGTISAYAPMDDPTNKYVDNGLPGLGLENRPRSPKNTR